MLLVVKAAPVSAAAVAAMAKMVTPAPAAAAVRKERLCVGGVLHIEISEWTAVHQAVLAAAVPAATAALAVLAATAVKLLSRAAL